MCEHIDWDLAAAGARRVLQANGLRIIEKIDPTDDGDFVLLSDRFARELAAVSGPMDRAAVARAINALDVKWNDIPRDQQAKIIAQASNALGVGGAKVWPKVEKRFTAQAKFTVGRTKIAAGRQVGLKISTAFNAVDQSIVDLAMKSQGFYVRNMYGKHAAMFSRQAQGILAQGLEAGLRNEEIVKDMAKAARSVGIFRTNNYWKVTASAFTNRVRTHTQLDRYEAAGIRQYQFQAIIDNRTTDICRSLDGQLFTVPGALRAYAAVEADAHFDSVRDHQPWVRTRRGENNSVEMFVKRRDGNEIPVGTVLRSGVGRADDRGESRMAMDNKQLEEFGLCTPPLHGLCRSVIVPI